MAVDQTQIADPCPHLRTMLMPTGSVVRGRFEAYPSAPNPIPMFNIRTAFVILPVAFLACARVSALEPLKPARPKITVTIGELPPDLKKQEDLVRRNVVEAVGLWTDKIECHASASLEVHFTVEDVVAGDAAKLGFGKSSVSASFNDGKVDGRDLKEQGMAYELRTGRDPNGDAPDIEICLQTAYVKREFWWDPEPEKRRKRAPAGKLDAVSVMLHETGHALAFNGWNNQKTGERNPSIMSTYDRHVIMKDGDFFFNGPEALKIWRGKPVPLARTNNNYHHVGDKRPDFRIPPKLVEDLMTGYNFAWAFKYEITPLDVAILKDCGVKVKEP